MRIKNNIEGVHKQYVERGKYWQYLVKDYNTWEIVAD